ncbi:hypothetical protein HDU96_005186 [Phlyctochytrium bullatum]|nr:hypothetical protein HDU96_005186 [Phlyctochytrium bullatum]
MKQEWAQTAISAFRNGLWEIDTTSTNTYKGRNVDLEDAFNTAAHLRSFELLEVLRKKHLKNSPDDFTEWPMQRFFMTCIEKDFMEGIDLIPSHHSTLNIFKDGKMPLLMFAVESGNPATVSFLLSKGARSGPFALSQAVSSCSCSLYIHPLINETCKPETAQIIRLLLDAGADPNGVEPPGDDSLTPLQFAAGRGCHTALRMFLEAGADPNVSILRRPFEAFVFMPLVYACRSLVTEAAEILLAHGADASIRGPEGQTLLHAVVFETSSRSWPRAIRKMIAFLISRGLDLEAKDNKNRTPLAVACWEGNIREAVELLRAGADPIGLSWFRAATPEAKENRRMLEAVAWLVRGGETGKATANGKTPGEEALKKAKSFLE